MSSSSLFRCLAVVGLISCTCWPESSFAEPPQTGTFRGVIQLKGEIPVLPPLVKKGDSNTKDAAVCAASAVPDESLVIDKKSRGIANVFVFLRKRPENYAEEESDAAKKPLVLDQTGCRLRPHAFVMRHTDRVKLINRNNIPHNMHTYPIKSTVYGLIVQPDQKGDVFLPEFDSPEPLPITIRCDIHPWMTAWVLPLDHPFADVTDKDGKFKIEGLPPGEYEFWFWQEKAGWLEKKYQVKIEAGEETAADLSYTADRFEP